MSGFSAEWLALREPADHAARADPKLVQWILPVLPLDRPIRVLDLACGAGSNLRCLAPQLGRPQHWTLVDHDAALLDAAEVAIAAWRQQAQPVVIEYECRRTDLVTELDALDFAKFDLVTTTALLDLVSEVWLHEVVDKCREARTAVLFALSYDGQMQFHPVHRHDRKILELFNRHQHHDKCFGPALGPQAPMRSRAALTTAGFRIETNLTPWAIEDRRLQTELIDGIARAAREAGSASSDDIAVWRQQRLAYISTGHSRLVVGHEDIAGRPGQPEQSSPK